MAYACTHTRTHAHTTHTHTHTHYSLDDVLGRTVAGRMQGHPSFVVSNVHICSVIQEEPHHLRLPINARLHTQQQHTQKKVNTPHDVTHVTHVITSHVTYVHIRVYVIHVTHNPAYSTSHIRTYAPSGAQTYAHSLKARK